MRALVVPSIGGAWQVKEVPKPEPGPHQVLIKIHASGICYTDVHITNGALPTLFPRTLGHEPAGEIVALGAGVRSRKVGDRVGVPWVQASCGRCEWCLRGKSLHCPEQIGTGVQAPGSHAEFMVAYADATMPIPDGLSYEQAAPIFCAGFTVYSGLRAAEPRPHERVAIVGSGGLGHLAIQYAKACGFETIAVTRSAGKASALRELGADEVVADGAALKARGGADVILGTSNSAPAMTDSMAGLRPEGRFVLMGLDAQEPFVLPVDFMMLCGKLIGSLQSERAYLYEALDFAAKGKVRVMEEIFRLDDIAKAYDKVAAGKVRFRAVVKP